MLDLQIVSDLHLSAPFVHDLSVPVNASCLALLGDVGNFTTHAYDYEEFLRHQLRKFQIVLLVPGACEAYGTSWPDAIARLRKFETTFEAEASLGMFAVLDRRSYRLPFTNTIVLGCTLFSRVSADQSAAVLSAVSDFHIDEELDNHMEDWDIAKHNAAHARDLQWLNEQVSKIENDESQPNMNIVICTHWCPTIHSEAVNPKNAETDYSSYFATDLSREPCFTSPAVKVWAFGQTHRNCDFYVERGAGADNLRLMSNQRGFVWEEIADFNEEKGLEFE